MGLLQSNCCLCLRLCLLKAGSGIRCRGGSRQVLPTAHLYSHAVSLNRATHVLKSQARVGGFRLHWKTGNPVGFNWGRHWTLRKLHRGLHRKVGTGIDNADSYHHPSKWLPAQTIVAVQGMRCGRWAIRSMPALRGKHARTHAAKR